MIFNALRRLFGMEPPAPISCEDALKKLHAYLDGELDALDCEKVEEHFELCQRCYPHLNLEQRFRARINRAMKRDACPEHVREKVLQSIGEESA